MRKLVQYAREVLSSEIPQTVNCTFLVADTSKPNIEPEVDRVEVHFGFFKLTFEEESDHIEPMQYNSITLLRYYSSSWYYSSDIMDLFPTGERERGLSIKPFVPDFPLTYAWRCPAQEPDSLCSLCHTIHGPLTCQLLNQIYHQYILIGSQTKF